MSKSRDLWGLDNKEIRSNGIEVGKGFKVQVRDMGQHCETGKASCGMDFGKMSSGVKKQRLAGERAGE